jgi:EPS-associated MarR family transcriptional regulator
MDTDVRYRILKLVEERPEITQRELARLLGVSVGKVNYCLRALINKGFIRGKNFTNSGQKRQHMYRLTSLGLTERTRVAIDFLKGKAAEFDEIREEIARLESQLAARE